APLVLKILDDLLSQLVNKVAVGGILTLVFFFYTLDPFVHIVCKTLVILFLGDVFLFKHMIQDFLPAFCIIFRIGHWIVSGRILRDAGDNGTLRQSQITDIFAEIILGSSLNSVISISKV